MTEMSDDLGYDDPERYETFSLYLCLDENRYLVEDVEVDPSDDDRMRCSHCKGDATEMNGIAILNREYLVIRSPHQDEEG